MDLYFTNFSIFIFHKSIFHELYFNPACTKSGFDYSRIYFSRIVSITLKLVKYESLEKYYLYSIPCVPCMYPLERELGNGV